MCLHSTNKVRRKKNNDATTNYILNANIKEQMDKETKRI